jgi:hypothetical protein
MREEVRDTVHLSEFRTKTNKERETADTVFIDADHLPIAYPLVKRLLMIASGNKVLETLEF